MKKLSAVLLLALILILAACGGESGGGANTNDGGKSDGGGEQAGDAGDADAEPATEREYPELEAKDFGGYEFTFLSRTINSPDWAEWNHRDLTAEEENGDTINDAVFLRNLKIEEKYNVTFKELVREHPAIYSDINKAVKAGDDIYGVV